MGIFENFDVSFNLNDITKSNKIKYIKNSAVNTQIS